MEIYILRDDEPTGPFTETEVRAQLVLGTITTATLIWWEGRAEWEPLLQTPLFVQFSIPQPSLTRPHLTRRTSGLAVISLITGLLGFICDPILALVAVITGHIARSKIKDNPNLKGQGMALTGLIFGYLWIAVFLAILPFYAEMSADVRKVYSQIQAQQEQAQEKKNSAMTDNPTTNQAPSDTNAQSPATGTNTPSTHTPAASSDTNALPSTNAPSQ